MAKYRRKPLVVEAVKITRPITIETSEGTMKGQPGDYLVTEVNGEQYPYHAEQFEKTYEPIKEHDIKKFILKVIHRIKLFSKEATQKK